MELPDGFFGFVPNRNTFLLGLSEYVKFFQTIFSHTVTSNRHFEAGNGTRTVRLLAFAGHLLARSWPLQATLTPSHGYLVAT